MNDANLAKPDHPLALLSPKELYNIFTIYVISIIMI